MAKRLGRRQSLTAKYEGGERRIDVVEFAAIARALGLIQDPCSALASESPLAPTVLSAAGLRGGLPSISGSSRVQKSHNIAREFAGLLRQTERLMGP